MSRASVCIVGASGYTGGELLRLLLDHPRVEVRQITSRRNSGAFAHATHPNLRGRTKLQFVAPEQVEACDVLLLCMPHGEAAGQIERWSGLAGRVIDLSADFRVKSRALRERWYGADRGESGSIGAWCDRFVYGLPELHRDRLRGARLASGVGCNATAVNLALLPLARAGVIESVVADLKVGSSEGGATASSSSHHPERSGAVRSFAPAGHRHQAEIVEQVMDGDASRFSLHMSVTSIERVRGVLCTAHVMLNRECDDRALWRLFREAYAGEPFVRIVKDRSGLHRYPDPKILCGSNCCDVGWELEPGTRRVVVLSAIDNLMKGAAGSAVQSMNLMMGFDETEGLGFAGLHPA
jgi:LysW-gamma-L-alpha-aminoadipyl-6-phosphate/LysW-L-glutamyl-5-phosphate reductase